MDNRIMIRKYRQEDIYSMAEIWNEVVEEGIAFPQEDCLTVETGEAFFAQQRIKNLKLGVIPKGFRVKSSK